MKSRAAHLELPLRFEPMSQTDAAEIVGWRYYATSSRRRAPRSWITRVAASSRSPVGPYDGRGEWEFIAMERPA